MLTGWPLRPMVTLALVRGILPVTERSPKFRTVKLTVLAAGSAAHSPARGMPAVLAAAGLVISVFPRTGRRPGGGQVVAGDAVDLDAVGPGQQRGVLAGRQFGGHDRPLGGVERLD
jgi:hypothetical protein